MRIMYIQPRKSFKSMLCEITKERVSGKGDRIKKTDMGVQSGWSA